MQALSTITSVDQASVPWPLCTIIMFLLVVNTMAQPAGRLCRHHRLRRTYLISSPLMCICDLIFVIGHLSSARLYKLFGGSTGMMLLLSERFSAPVPEDHLHALVQHTRLRWLFFVLGPLPAVLLLLGLSGVMWTQVLGSIFLAEWLMSELLICISTIPRFSAGEHENVPDLQDITTFTGYCFVGSTIFTWTTLLWIPIFHFEIIKDNPFISLAVNLLFLCTIPPSITWGLVFGPDFLGLGTFLERHMTLSKGFVWHFPMKRVCTSWTQVHGIMPYFSGQMWCSQLLLMRRITIRLGQGFQAGWNRCPRDRM